MRAFNRINIIRSRSWIRRPSTLSKPPTAIVIGAYAGTSKTPEVSLNSSDSGSFLSQESISHIQKQLSRSSFKAHPREVRVLYDVQGVESMVVITGLGKKDVHGEEKSDSVRHAAAHAVKSIRSVVIKDKERSNNPVVLVDSLGDWKSASEGAFLAQFAFNEFKSKKESDVPIDVQPLGNDSENVREWENGRLVSEAQNLARRLKETPANHLTPSLFAQKAVDLFKNVPNVEVHVRDLDWIESKKMGAFLSVSRGSDQPPKFLEIHYTGGGVDEAPIALVGKGVTFDSGGISLKPSRDMHLMKGDMGGAAAVLASLWGISSLKLRKNVIAFIPLTENMPNGRATKPGDVVTAMNGKTIEIQNTDAEGRLILADAIYYAASEYRPSKLIEMSTLTGAMDVALGAGYAGVFTNSDELWKDLEAAGKKTCDRFWRMPLDPHYTSLLKSSVADLNNIGPGSAGSCTAAAFLNEFLPKQKSDVEDGSDQSDKEETVPFAHIDIAGVMYHRGLSDSLIPSGMTGRPTRSIIEFVASSQ